MRNRGHRSGWGEGGCPSAGVRDGPSRRAEAAAAGHTVLHTAGPGEDWRPSLHRREADAPGEGPVHVYFAASGAEGCADRPWLPASGSQAGPSCATENPTNSVLVAS